MLPIIGITTELLGDESRHSYLGYAYTQAIEQARGIPVAFPPLADLSAVDRLVEGIDGLLLTGGADIDPARFGQSLHPKTKLIPAVKEAFDFRLLERALEQGKPVLAICLGSQEVCVHFGGRLVQDITDQVPGAIAHRSPNKGEKVRHPIAIEPGSLLHRILGASSIEVNSSHHQAVAELPAVLRADARTADGLIEAMDHPGYPFVLGVQWHPELLRDQEPHVKVFQAFIATAKRRMETTNGH